MAVSPKFKKVSKTLDRVVSAARIEQQARDALVEQVRTDQVEFLDRERRRCHLVGSWILTKHAAWFAASDRQESFTKWLKADRRLKREVSLFGPDADSDLLTPDKAVAMAREAGLESLAEGLREALDDVPFDSAAVVVSPAPSPAPSSESAGGEPAVPASTSPPSGESASSSSPPQSSKDRGGGAPPDTAAA